MAGGRRSLTRAETLVSALAHLPKVEGSMDVGSLAHVAALVGTVLTRDDLDRSIVGVARSAGIDGDGVSGWLSGMSDEDLASAFGVDLRPPHMSELSEIAGWRGKTVPDEVLDVAVGILMSANPGRAAVAGSGDVASVVAVKTRYPDAAVVCRTPSERAAVGLGLALSGFGSDVPPIVDLRWRERYDSSLVIDGTGVIEQIVDSIAGKNADTVLVVPRSFLTLQRLDLDRGIFAASGNLRAVVDASKDYGVIVLDNTAKDHDSPVYMARTWGPGFNRFGGDAVDTVVNRRTVEYVSGLVPVEMIGASGTFSLSPSTYMEVVPPYVADMSGDPYDDVNELLDRYERLAGSMTELHMRFVESARKVLAAVQECREGNPVG